MVNFKGVGVALVTPFLKDKEIDYTSLTKLINSVIDGGVDYLVVLGTTAETATLSATEKERVVHHILSVNNGRIPVVLGVGGNNTAQVISEIKEADLQGISAILSVCPYYNKPNQEGIFQHFSEIAKNSPLPIILYNVPGRTGVNMSAETTLKLAHKYSNIIAIKEASGNLGQIAYILRDRPNHFLVISGDDNLTLPTISLGGDGVISVSANSFPEKFSNMVHLALEGKTAQAATLNLELHEVTDLLFAEGNPCGVKAALEIKGVVQNNLKLPLINATDNLSAKIKVQIEKYSL